MEEEDYGYGSSEDELYNDEDYDDDDQGYDELNDDSDYGSNRGAASCKVITKESLLAAQKDDLQRVMDLLSLKEHHARTLLIHYRWDVEKVFTVFVEKGGEQLYKEAGVSVVDSDVITSSDDADVTCEICYDEFPPNERTTMECGHCFCNECWTEHFIVKINEGKSRRITCMAHKCFSICDEDSIRTLVSARDPKLAEKFDRYLLESYIEDNKRVKWCPSVPHCGNAVRVEKDEYCEVECICGQQFCFSCSSVAHSPCSCLMWELWEKKCKNDSEDVKWISENIKLCPKCHKPVEKNGGCNLVQCLCGQPFCWLCGAATGLDHTWNNIVGHECGRYKEDHGHETESAMREMWRYTHYYNRHRAHLDSLKAEENLNKKLQQKMAFLESRVLEVKDYTWATNGFFRLMRSRQILSYSYAFAYFMFGDELFANEMTAEERMIKQNLFEDQQQQLEMHIEKLSMLLEEPFANYAEEKVNEIRMKTLSLTAVTDNLCRKVHECIDNELLGSLQQTNHITAPYRSKGIEKASELPDS